jgi:hypothetical protein
MPGQAVTRNMHCAGFNHFSRRAWRTGTDGVSQRHLITAHCVQIARDTGDLVCTDLALIRATQHAGDITAHFDSCSLGCFKHRCEALDAFGDRAIDIALGERFGSGSKYGDFSHASLKGGFQALEIGR